MKKYELNAVGLTCPMPVIKTKKALEENQVVETLVDNEIATQNLEKLATQLGYNYKKVKRGENFLVTISKNEESEEDVIDTFGQSCVVPVTKVKRALEKEKEAKILIEHKKNVDELTSYADKNNLKYVVENLEVGYKVTVERPEEFTKKENNVSDESYIVVVNKKIMGHGSEELGKGLIKSYFYALTEQEVLPDKIIFYNDGSALVDKKTTHIADELVELDERGVEIVCCGACIDYHNVEMVVGNATNMYFIVEDMRKANRIIRP